MRPARWQGASTLVLDESDALLSGATRGTVARDILLPLKFAGSQTQVVFAAATLPAAGKQSVSAFLDKYYASATRVRTAHSHSKLPNVQYRYVDIRSAAPAMDTSLADELAAARAAAVDSASDEGSSAAAVDEMWAEAGRLDARLRPDCAAPDSAVPDLVALWHQEQDARAQHDAAVLDAKRWATLQVFGLLAGLDDHGGLRQLEPGQVLGSAKYSTEAIAIAVGASSARELGEPGVGLEQAHGAEFAEGEDWEFNEDEASAVLPQLQAAAVAGAIPQTIIFCHTAGAAAGLASWLTSKGMCCAISRYNTSSLSRMYAR